MRRFKPTLWLSFGLVSLTLALSLTAYVLGLMPDGYKAEIEARAKVAESLAVQIAGAVNRRDNLTLSDTMTSVVRRNPDVLSSALRRADGSVVLEAGNHAQHWVAPDDGKSTPTHVLVPLLGPDGVEGSIEMSFGPASSGKRVFGISASILMFLAFIMASGFIGYFFILRRTLHQLDPGRVIPERVQKSFDTLSEGVILLDEKERILLVNQAFAEIYGQKGGPPIGSKINNLPWRMVDGSARAGGYPWHAALREERPMRKDALSLRTANGRIHNFDVNATVITGDKDRTIGAIVTLSDMTSLKRSEEDLAKTTELLQQTEEQIVWQNSELAYLTNHDPLSGCLNRRTLFQRLGADLEAGTVNRIETAILMVDIDDFKRVNELHGQEYGDRIIVGLADVLKVRFTEPGYVARYSGDRFCVVLSGAEAGSAERHAEALCMAVSSASGEYPELETEIEVSIGVAIAGEQACTADELIHRASQALRHAKQVERNIVRWSEDVDADSVPDLVVAVKEADKGAPQGHKQRASDSINQSVQRLPEGPKVSSKGLAAQETEAVKRATFEQTVEQTVSRAQRLHKPCAVVHLSIVSWDYLAEALGENPSQRVVRALKRETVAALRDHDHVHLAENAGELLISLSELETADDATWVIRRLLDKLRAPVNVDGKSVYISCKAGMALYPRDAHDAATLIRHSGVAMRRALDENLLDGMKFYSSEMLEESRQRMKIESGIREALREDEFELYFQPIIDIRTGALSAAEALLRCSNESIKNVRMDQVIDVAEKSALITEIDTWVLTNALKHMQEWCDARLHLPKVSINLSATQLTNLQLMDGVFEKVSGVNFSPTRIQIEVTETARMSDVEIAATQLKRLQHLGVQIALDDFGTGQASLTYLQRLHPDVIKIDRSFVTGVNTNHANATLVSAMTVMAHCLGLKVVVEGVEEDDELNFLRDTRCDEVQGYLISKPMPARDMSEWMEKFVGEHGAKPYAADPTVRAAGDTAADSRAA